MAINEELTRIKNAKEAIKTSIEAKGVTVGDGTIDTYASKIDEIQDGVDINEYYDLTKKSNGNVTKYIKNIPLIDTSDYTSMRSMFSGYSSLATIPLLNTSNVTDMYFMFANCSSLTTIPKLDTSKVTNIAQMFNFCSSLTTIPQIDTSKVSSIFYMFNGCTSLIEIPQLDTSSVTNIDSIIYNCSNVTTLGGFINLGKAYLTTQSANNSAYTLNLSYSNNLTHDSLMNVINNLYDIATAGVQPQQLVLGSTNLAKLTEDEIALATNKGWTVS